LTAQHEQIGLAVHAGGQRSTVEAFFMSNTDANRVRPYFAGFSGPKYTGVPDVLFDELLSLLSGAELKVLLYLMRRTFGFKKDSDSISLSQICRGISRKDGTALDHGTGLSQSTAQLALKELVAMNIVHATRNTSPNVEMSQPPTASMSSMPYQLLHQSQTPLPKIGKGVYRKSVKPSTRKSATQETVVQDTAIDSGLPVKETNPNPDGNLSKFRKGSAKNFETGENKETTQAQTAQKASLP